MKERTGAMRQWKDDSTVEGVRTHEDPSLATVQVRRLRLGKRWIQSCQSRQNMEVTKRFK